MNAASGIKRIAATAVALLLAGSLCAATPEIERMAAKGREKRVELLMGHSVNPSGEALVRFLEEGFPDKARTSGLPERPFVKTEIVLTAIQEIGYREEQSAVPVLLEILDGKMPKGIESVLQYDLEKQPVEVVDDSRQMYSGLIRFNALIALGYIGDPKAGDAIRAVASTDTGTSYRVGGALSLAMMNDASALEILVSKPVAVDSPTLAQYFAAVYQLTGRNYNITDVSAVARRRKAIAEFAAWVAENGKSFAPSREAVLRRSSEGVPLQELPPNSLRWGLRTVKRFEDFDKRYAAREYLKRTAPAMIPELRSICEDPVEDLDIRMSAMEWYSASQPKEARKTMRGLLEDENPQIAEQAKRMATEIELAMKAKKES